MSLQVGAEAKQSDLMASGLTEASSSIDLFLNSQQMLSGWHTFTYSCDSQKNFTCSHLTFTAKPMQYEMCLPSSDIKAKFHPSTLVSNAWQAMRKNVAVLEQTRRQINAHRGLHLTNYGI